MNLEQVPVYSTPPQELEQVLSHYPVKVSSVQTVQDEIDAGVWRIETPWGPLILKHRKFRNGRAIFALEAQRYLHARGIPVPAIYPTRDGAWFVLVENRAYSLSDWVEGRTPVETDPADLALMVKGMASLHAGSSGFYPPEGCKIANRFWDWPRRYNKILTRFNLWRQQAEQRRLPGDLVFLQHVDRFIERGTRALEDLVCSAYNDWVSRCSFEGMLVHRDYGSSNSIILPDGRLVIIDLDTVAHDVPARDLRAMYASVVKNLGQPYSLLSNMLAWYTEVNALSPEEIEVLLIDLEFPHRFHEAARACYKKGELGEGKILREVEIEAMKEEAVNRYRLEHQDGRPISPPPLLAAVPFGMSARPFSQSSVERLRMRREVRAQAVPRTLKRPPGYPRVIE